jgi:hypothetical protein
MRFVRSVAWFLARLEIAAWAGLISAWLVDQLAVLPQTVGGLIGVVTVIATLHLLTRRHGLPGFRSGANGDGTVPGQAPR